MLRTLGRTTWDEIEVGEVFAWNGCWSIGLKRSSEVGWLIAADEHGISLFDKNSFWNEKLRDRNNLYKLPKSVQRLWRTD